MRKRAFLKKRGNEGEIQKKAATPETPSGKGKKEQFMRKTG